MTKTDMIVDWDIEPQHKQTKTYLSCLLSYLQSFSISFYIYSFFLSMSGFDFEYLYVCLLLLPILRPQNESSSFLMKMLAFNINAVFLNFRSLLAIK